jgi:hypothetical protein
VFEYRLLPPACLFPLTKQYLMSVEVNAVRILVSA